MFNSDLPDTRCVRCSSEELIVERNEIGILLDRSGSMSGSEERTVEAINGFISQMQADKLGAVAHFTMITFDSQGIDPVRRGIMSEVQPLRSEEFVPRAATPLYDAVGDTIAKIDGKGKRILVILTDGLENCSKKFSHEQICALIEAKRTTGWVLIYLGANIDAWKQAESIGIPGEMAMNYKQSVATPPPAQVGQAGLFDRFTSNVAQHPMGYALGAAAVLGTAYLALWSGDANATESLGFTDIDRNASMGVDGVSQSWLDAVTDDVANFVEPIPSDSIFDLPPDVAEAQANLPEDFDPAMGSMIEGEQMTDTGGDILSPADVLSGEYTTASVDDLFTGGEPIVDGTLGRDDFGSTHQDHLGGVNTEGNGLSDLFSSGVEVGSEVAHKVADIAGDVASGIAEATTSLFD